MNLYKFVLDTHLKFSVTCIQAQHMITMYLSVAFNEIPVLKVSTRSVVFPETKKRFG